MDDFLSQRFSNIYLSNAIPDSVKLQMVDSQLLVSTKGVL